MSRLIDGEPRPSQWPWGGQVEGRTLRKRVSIRHRLRFARNGYALACAQLDEAEAAGAVEVELIERETGARLLASIELVRRRGWPVHFDGFEPQKALPLDEWQTIKTDAGVKP